MVIAHDSHPHNNILTTVASYIRKRIFVLIVVSVSAFFIAEKAAVADLIRRLISASSLRFVVKIDPRYLNSLVNEKNSSSSRVMFSVSCCRFSLSYEGRGNNIASVFDFLPVFPLCTVNPNFLKCCVISLDPVSRSF